jgi:hypothetical protein
MAAQVTAQLLLNAEQFRRSIKDAQGDMEGLKDKAKQLGDNLKSALVPAVRSATLLSGAFVAAGATVTAVYGGMIKSGIGLNSQIQQAEITFKAFTKSAETARDIVSDLREKGLTSPFATTDIIESGKALISSAKGSRQELSKLVDTAQILAAMRPDQGLAGAAFAIREAMGGNLVSLQRRFDIPLKLIKELRKQGMEGLELINALLERLGAGPELVTGLGKSYEGLKSSVGDFWDEVKIQISSPVFEELQAGLSRFVETIRGADGEKVTDWASQLGEKFGGATREMIDSLSKFEWESFLDGATRAGEAVARMATNIAQIVDKLSTATYHMMNFVDTTEAISNKVLPALPGSSLVTKYNPIRAVLGQGGKTEGDYDKDYVRSIARIRARQRGEIIVGDPLDKSNIGKWNGSAAKVETAADIIKAGPTTATMMEQINKRGFALPSETMMMEQNYATTKGISVAELRKRQASDAAALAQLGVDINVTERNPQHDVMAV